VNVIAAPHSVHLSLEGVSFSVGGQTLLSAIDLEVSGSGCMIVLGPNGAGKSLLLRLCHGLLTPTAGVVRWNGGAPGKAMRRRQAMVFQRPVMLRRSALDNVAYPLKLAGVDRATRRRRADEALERFGLSALAPRAARVLSGGEQQRLALARAWVTRPDILFLDEPTASLDPAASYQVEAAVRAFLDAGVKVMLVTHDLAQARRLADEMVFLFRGRVCEQGAAADFFAGPKTREARAFLGGDLIW
jgi:tungstate transport system ATP-binding protein